MILSTFEGFLLMMPGGGHLVDLIYASLLGEASWQQFLDEVTATESEKAMLLMHGSEADSRYFGVTSGLEDRAVRDYNQHYGARNVLQDSLGTRPSGTVLADKALLPAERLTGTEFYADYLVPYRVTSTVGLKITGNSRCFYSLTLGHAHESEQRVESATLLLRRLFPHLKRVFEAHGGSKMAHKWALPFESLGIGAIVLGARGQVKHVSGAAESMLKKDSPLAISPVGRITIKDEAAHGGLMRMLSRSYDGPKTYTALHGRSKLTLVAVETDHITTFFEGPTVLVLIEQPSESSFDPGPLARAYSLTNAEVRALTGIANGWSVDQIATKASLSRETIRQQIKSLYAKTDAHSQADILRLIHFSLPMQ